MKGNFYDYRARVVRVIDGDTVVLNVDLGFDIHHTNMTVRLWGINAPEMNTPEGKQARAWLVEKLANQTDILFDSRKDKADKYGRYLAVLWRDGDISSLNDQMVVAGHAQFYMRDRS